MRKSKYVKCIYIFNIFLIVYIVNSALVSCPQFKDLKKNVCTVFSKKAMLSQVNNTINIFFIFFIKNVQCLKYELALNKQVVD